MSLNNSLTEIYTLYKSCSGICTDTRKVTNGSIFFALKGDNFNGNKFAKQALESGAAFAVIDQKEFEEEGKTILVEDSLKTLQALANYHRKQFSIPFIGITGSNGKTTSKELISCVLKTKFKTHFTQGNLNNHIGVPLTLLSMPLDTEIAVIEMGANHVGEIEFLSTISDPTHGLITNIGKAHLEGFGSLEGVARGKSELFKHLQNNNGVIFINGSSDALMRMASRFKNPLIYSQTDEKAYVFAKMVEIDPFIRFSYGSANTNQTQLVGSYNFENILSALAIGKFFGIEPQDAIEAVCNYVPSNNRSQIIENSGVKILLDAYNANPSSMAAAIENLNSLEHPKKIIVLGDMFELGVDSKLEHTNIYNKAISQGFHACYFVGKYFKNALPETKNVFDTKEELVNELKRIDLKKSLLLIKGSRGIGLETILDKILEQEK